MLLNCSAHDTRVTACNLQIFPDYIKVLYNLEIFIIKLLQGKAVIEDCRNFHSQVLELSFFYALHFRQEKG